MERETWTVDRIQPPKPLPNFSAGDRVADGSRKEVVAMFIDIVMFILSALGLVGAGREFLRRGQNLGFWG